MEAYASVPSVKGEKVKKLLVSALILGIAVIAGCAGDDDPAGPGGTLATVQNLVVSEASTGNSIVLTWSAVESVDGYKVYFRETADGNWAEVGTESSTTFTHTATVAGYYTVRAYKGNDYSEQYANPVNTLPNIVNTIYRIYDNFAPANYDSGFIFGPNSGQTGKVTDPNFKQDIYAYDESKGDPDVWLYSGDYGQFGNGNRTYMADPKGDYGCCNPYGSGEWYQSYRLYQTDKAVFCALPYSSGNVIYVKMYGLAVSPEPSSQNGTEVAFMYEYQTMENVTVFTSNY